jgi:hypothetical protein
MYAAVCNAEVRGGTTRRMLFKYYMDVRGNAGRMLIFGITLWLIPERMRQPLVYCEKVLDVC